MTIADTIISMKQHTQNAYNAVEALGGDLPDNLNLENLADAIQSTAKVTPVGPWGRVIYVEGTKAIGISLQTQDEFNALANNGNLNSTITIQDKTFAKSRVASFTFGANFPTTLPDYFLYYFTSLGVGGISVIVPSGVTTIGNYFMGYCINYNFAMSLPASVTSIGTFFRAYNAGVSVTNLTNTKLTTIPDYFHYANYRLTSSTAVAIPEGVVFIGNDFLGNCRFFNASITLPSTVKTIGARFLENCFAFNSALTIKGKITSIGNSFLKGSQAFNQSLTIEGDNGTIGDKFLYGTYLATTTNSINLTGSWSAIANDFMSYSLTVRVPINIAGNNLTIGDNFLRACSSFNQSITFSGSINSIGNYFMAYCSNFGKTLFGPPTSEPYTALSTVESIGANFMAYSYTLNVYTPPALKTLGAGFLFKAEVSNVYHYSPLLEDIPGNFCYGCCSAVLNPEIHIGSWVKTIGDNFCAFSAFSALGRTIYDSSTQAFSLNGFPIFSSIVTIGTNFLYNCRSLLGNPSWALNLTALTQINPGFMRDCNAFTGRVDFGGNITFADSYNNGYQPLSSSRHYAPSYTVGITIGGAGASKVLEKLANSTATYYRKLKAVG